jgi:hypothetical protein
VGGAAMPMVYPAGIMARVESGEYLGPLGPNLNASPYF